MRTPGNSPEGRDGQQRLFFGLSAENADESVIRVRTSSP